jgi:hypothetical protein
MLEKLRLSILALSVATLACSGTTPGGASADASPSGAGSGGTTGTGGATGTGGVSDGGNASGGATGADGATIASDAGDGGDATVAGPGGAPESFLPAGYKGKPFKVQTIPGTIHAADYDLGGPGVAYCHGNANDCAATIMPRFYHRRVVAAVISARPNRRRIWPWWSPQPPSSRRAAR